MCQVLAGLRLLDTVQTYGIDGLAGLNAQAGFLADLGLNVDTFYDKLYIQRPKTEKELLNHFLAGGLNVSVVAPIGTGKTTLLHKVIRDFTLETHLPAIVVDLKTTGIITPTPSGIFDLVNNEGKKQIRSFMNRHSKEASFANPLDFMPLIKILLNPVSRDYIQSSNLVELQKLESMYQVSLDKLNGNINFVEWVGLVLATANHSDRKDVKDCIVKFESCLGLVELAYAVAEYCRTKYGKKNRSKLVIALDNLDALEGPELRESLCQWMRTRSGMFEAVAVFAACVRPHNVYQFTKKPKKIEGLWGGGGCLSLTTAIDPTDVASELIAEWVRRIDGTKRDRNSPFDDDEDALTEAQKAKLAFEDAILSKRLEFVSIAINDGKINNISIKQLKAVATAASEVLAVPQVCRDMDMQANGNRRELLAGVSNFLEYVVKDLGLEWDIIGKAVISTSARKGQPIEIKRVVLISLYYKYLGSQKRADVGPPVFDTSVFDPVRWCLESGWGGRDGQELLSTAKQVAVASRGLLVTLGVFNACGNTLSAWSDEAVTVKRVAETCALMGLEENETYETLTTIVQSVDPRYAGLFDIDHFLPIHMKEHVITGTEKIVATDRCRRLVSVVIYMFNYLCERIRHVHQGLDIDDKDLLYRGLVAPQTVLEFPKWIAKFVPVESMWIESIHTHESSQIHSLSSSFNKYCDLFLVKRNQSQRDTTLAKVMTVSAIKFLKYALNNIIRDDEYDLKAAYEHSLNCLQSIDRILDNAVDRVLRGQTWSIPRNRALRY